MIIELTKHEAELLLSAIAKEAARLATNVVVMGKEPFVNKKVSQKVDVYAELADKIANATQSYR